MCLICVDFQRSKLTITEAWRNLAEMRESLTDEHHDEVVAMIIERIHDDAIEADDEEQLGKLLENLEQTGQLTFGWDEPEFVDYDEDFELDYPGDYYED